MDFGEKKHIGYPKKGGYLQVPAKIPGYPQVFAIFKGAGMGLEIAGTRKQVPEPEGAHPCAALFRPHQRHWRE